MRCGIGLLGGAWARAPGAVSKYGGLRHGDGGPQGVQVGGRRTEHEPGDEGQDRDRENHGHEHRGDPVGESLNRGLAALGLLHQQRRDRPAAAAAFDTYLAKAPNAPDAALVRGYLEELRP